MKVFFLIRSLQYGGAQRQLVNLANGLAPRGHEPIVAVFYPEGELAAELDPPVARVSLDKRGRWDVVRFVGRLAAEVRRRRPDVVHGYLPVANLFALTPRLFGVEVPVVWGMRASDMELTRYGRVERGVYRLCERLSRRPDGIIVNSEAGRDVLKSRGYPADAMAVIPNGIDTERFRPDEGGRAGVRAEWGVPEEALLFGLVGRIDPMKGHSTFLRAAAAVAETHPEMRGACVGQGEPGLASELRALAAELGLAERVIWSAPRRDVRALMNGLDVLVLASGFGEGFPNVVGEAMACGTPCVVTDVGDAASIVGETGLVVPPDDPAAMAAAWRKMLSRTRGERAELGRRARERVRERFGVDQLVESTERFLTDVALGPAPAGRD